MRNTLTLHKKKKPFSIFTRLFLQNGGDARNFSKNITFLKFSIKQKPQKNGQLTVLEITALQIVSTPLPRPPID